MNGENRKFLSVQSSCPFGLNAVCTSAYAHLFDVGLRYCQKVQNPKLIIRNEILVLLRACRTCLVYLFSLRLTVGYKTKVGAPAGVCVCVCLCEEVDLQNDTE